MLIDAVYARSVEHIERSHPFGVAFRQIVVDGHHVHAASGERAQEYRQCGYKSFALTGSHLGDLALMEHHAAYELHVVVDHIPGDLVASGKPVVFPDGLVAFDADKLLACGGQIAIHLCGCNLNGRIGGKACGGFAHGSEHYRKVLVELVLYRVEYVFFMTVYFIPQRLTLVERQCLDLGLESGDRCFVGFYGLLDVSAHIADGLSERIVVERFYFFSASFDFVDDWLYLLEIAL